MLNYKIYHAPAELTEANVHSYKLVAIVQASSLEEAWLRAHSEYNDKYADMNVRSVKAGDLIIPDVPEAIPMLVLNRGFAQVGNVLLPFLKLS